MRWQFVDFGDQQELAEREIVASRIDSWWSEFQGKTDQLEALFSRKADWDLPAWMAANLGSIDKGLMWEFGPALSGAGRRLVITPEIAHHLHPLVTAILKRAPRLPGWEFYDNRPPEGVADTLLTVKARTGCDVSGFKVGIERGEHNRVNITYSAPAIASEGETAALNAAFVTSEGLLGERCLDRWIGAIEVKPAPKAEGLQPGNSPHYVALGRLQETVAAVTSSIREQLPERPHYQWLEEAKWCLWQLTPAAHEEYCRQDDLFIAKSANPPMWAAAHSGTSFYSERFSRCGETFCFLKIDGSEGLEGSEFSDKTEIEDALDTVLKSAGLGCYIGGGMGQRYAYIDLALCDLSAGIKAIRERMQSGRIPKRSWIQFYDADLAAEWVGIFADSPPPALPFDGDPTD
jgi:hypothetical protein